MNILFLLDNVYAPDARVQKEINSLIKVGFTIYLVCLKGNSKAQSSEKLKIYRILDKRINKYYYYTLKKEIDETLQIIKANNITIIHAHDHFSLELACRIKRKYSIKIIYDAHEYIHGWLVYQNEKNTFIKLKSWLIHKLYSRREKLNLKRIDSLITVSNSIAKLYREKRNVEKKVTVLRNIPPSNNMQTESINYFSGKHLSETFPKNKLKIVHSGAWYYNSQTTDYFLSEILELSRIQPIKVILLIREVDTKKIKNSNFFNSVKEHIVFHPYLPYNRLVEFISNADIGILLNYKPHWLSHWFSLPNRIFDYVNAGLVLATTPQPEFMKIINDYEVGFSFDIYKKGSLSKETFDSLKKIDFFKKNISIARKELTWENEEPKLLDIYNGLAS